MKVTTRILGGLAALTMVLASCGGSGSSDDTAQPPLDTSPTTTIAVGEGTVMDYLASQPQYSVLTSLIKDAGLEETLNTGAEFTVFAPSDTVFNAMPSATLAALKDDPENLKTLLLNHVLDVETLSIDLLDGEIEMLSGAKVDVKLGDPINVNGFPLTKIDVRVMNGVVHEIAGVITD